jgi:hypothetical protein
MADTPQTQKREPPPRPPRQPDAKLITYLERAKDAERNRKSWIAANCSHMSSREFPSDEDVTDFTGS